MYLHLEKFRILVNWSNLGLDISKNEIKNNNTWNENEKLWEDNKFNPYYKLLKKLENKIDNFTQK